LPIGSAVSGPSQFQSTPPRGRRREIGVNSVVVAVFQSTPPRGRRLKQLAGNSRVRAVSIHASTRETTLKEHSPTARPVVSIHASTREATLGLLLYSNADLFQSTPPRGRRLTLTGKIQFAIKFQSTPPRGRRL